MIAIAEGSQSVLDPEVEHRIRTRPETPWITIVFNDPVNLMSYVTYVFQSYFGYTRAHAEKLMLEVHEDGRSVVATGSREEMERDTAALHGFGLWAACRRSDRGHDA